MIPISTYVLFTCNKIMKDLRSILFTLVLVSLTNGVMGLVLGPGPVCNSIQSQICAIFCPTPPTCDLGEELIGCCCKSCGHCC